MYEFRNNIALVGVAAALSITPTLAVAQDDAATAASEPAGPTTAMTPEQDAAMQAWPAQQQAVFKLWPAETQAYYWSLSEERQKMFWALSDSDKVALGQMAEPQRESTWAQIEARLMPSAS
jgi:hypothetical protein